MQSEWLTFFLLGFEHVTDPAGYDHMLFVIGLCAALPPENWRRILGLVTAFTLGHCITLLLASRFGSVFSADLVEGLVALSILLAGLGNLYWSGSGRGERNFGWYFGLTFFFGLVHGLAFSNFFRALGSAADELWRQLLSFNLGVEIGQLATVAWFMLLHLLLRGLLSRWNGEDEAYQATFLVWWNRIVSSLVVAAGVYLLVDRLL